MLNFASDLSKLKHAPTNQTNNSKTYIYKVKCLLNQSNKPGDGLDRLGSLLQYWTGFCKARINEYLLNLLPFVLPPRTVGWTLCDQSAH